MCTRIIIIKDGRLVADFTPGAMQAQAAGRSAVRATIQGPEADVKAKLSSAPGVGSVEVLGRHAATCEYRVRAADGADLGPAVYRAVTQGGWCLHALEPERRSLEDVYLQLTASRPQPAAAAS
ncbi:MAG: hypothetical protein HY721_16530 [Planctomycetes bacterium]|nr:hypothetical protein [Planctomycetota bacterium]